ncbi:MAG: UvrD-helicase domain-containing protein [Alistipes sp.]|nr:UvrD-helicase domain-containing protein [Alistipes sp.]
MANISNEDILKGLNPAQRAAVEAYNEPSLIIAGAGSGKTRVLTTRIAYMLAQGVPPHAILALTFTNKAAREMRERIEAMIGTNSRYICMGTFHSVFSRILRDNAEILGYPKEYTIYEPTDSKNLLKTILKEKGLSDDKYKPGLLASRISMAKNNLITPGAYLQNSMLATEDRKLQIPEFGNIYLEYCKRCKANGAMDFDDLLLQTNILFRDHPEVLARYQERFQYVLVDEYQDTNQAQYIIIRRLAQHHSRICVVGDDAQSIYSFRGAKIENILSFQRDYPQAKVFKLEQNYRSTQTIVDAANSVIDHNSRRLKKRCFSEGATGEKIRIFKAYTDREEADLVVSDLRDRVRENGSDWSDVAILYRTNNQSQALENSLRQRGIPYIIYKGSSFYDHKEVKDMLSYIRLIINPRDDEAFKRIINTPARGIGDTTVARIEAIAQEQQVSMWEAVDTMVERTPADSVEKAIVKKVTEFVGLIRSLSLEREHKGLYDFGMEVAVRSGLLPFYRLQNTPEAQSAVGNLEEVVNSMQMFNEQVEAEIRNGEREDFDRATIEEWLQSLMLLTDMDNKESEEENKDRVTLMTVHSAKGLEYEYVYVVGCEENLFPSLRALETVEGIEEERRLFYVALTRAKSLATLSCVDMRFKWGSMEFSKPSRFLKEIDEQYVECDFNLHAKPRGEQGGVKVVGGSKDESAIDALRRRFDVRYQQKARDERRETRDERKVLNTQLSTLHSPLSTSQRDVSGMRRVNTSTVGQVTSEPCAYSAGERVEHPKFGKGEIVQVVPLATDHKLVVRFVSGEEKTLLSKLAKLTKL